MSDFEINNDTSYSSYDDSDYGGYDPNDQGGYLLPEEDSGDGGFNQNDEEEFGANYNLGADEYISNFNDLGNEVDSNLEIGPDDQGGYLFSGEDSGDDWGFCSDDSYYGGYDINDQGGYLFSGEDGEDGWDFSSDDSINQDGDETWTTMDFAKHYFTGDERSVKLKNVGLDDDFESTIQVQEAEWYIKNAAELAVRQSGEADVVFNNTAFLCEVGDDDLSNPLYSLGSGWLSAQGSCSEGRCNIQFKYSDLFADPLDIGIEVPFGKPYTIEHEFSKKYEF